MNKIEFTYQRYWLRVFSFIPLLFLLAYIDNLIEIPAILFVIICFFVFVNFHRLSLLLVKRKGCVRYTEQSISFFAGCKKISFNVGDIRNIDFNEIKPYRAKIGQMIVSFKDDSKKKLVLYSEDLEDNAIQSSSLYSVYQSIKDLIHE